MKWTKRKMRKGDERTKERGIGSRVPTPREAFAALWDSNAKRGFGWDANPWVWALTFRRVEADARAA